ncbi:MAG TPA: iron ABC transporter permease [Syntrophomonadaceae bacterium]|nr:iron ABC transporter permease [Syntrophomonadaceae bacterium]
MFFSDQYGTAVAGAALAPTVRLVFYFALAMNQGNGFRCSFAVPRTFPHPLLRSLQPRRASQYIQNAFCSGGGQFRGQVRTATGCLGTLFTSGTSLIKYLADPYEKRPAITFWQMGSLAAISPRDVLGVVAPVVVGLIPLHLLRWRLNVLSLGEEEARTLGLDTGRLRIVVILCATLMTAAPVSVSGMIGWVGLIVPHLARVIVGPNYRELLPVSILIGSAYLLLVDDLARGLASAESPLGILTVLRQILPLQPHRPGGQGPARPLPVHMSGRKDGTSGPRTSLAGSEQNYANRD